MAKEIFFTKLHNSYSIIFYYQLRLLKTFWQHLALFPSMRYCIRTNGHGPRSWIERDIRISGNDGEKKNRFPHENMADTHDHGLKEMCPIGQLENKAWLSAMVSCHKTSRLIMRHFLANFLAFIFINIPEVLTVE